MTSYGEISQTYRSSYPSARLHRSTSIETYHVRVYLENLNTGTDFTIVDALKNTLSEDIVRTAVSKMRLGRHQQYELVETFFSSGQMVKEKRLDAKENPVRIQLLWPKATQAVADVTRTEYRFFLRKKEPDKKVGVWTQCATMNNMDAFINVFVPRAELIEYPDLCNLPDLNETTLLDNLKHRFANENIYTYIGSILISVNPFKYYPIYNPKQIKQYQNKRLTDNPPHVFAIADAAYHQMLRERENQCIVISGESGSGKTESTNLLLSQLSALSQKGSARTDGVEQTILGAGPVLEAFGNAKTVHNNNSSRFGKFIQVNYKENGIVHGAVVEKYLLEKSRLVHQAPNERNYHVFYYLLMGSSDEQKERLGLTQPENFHYLSQYAEYEESMCYQIEDADGIVDEGSEFERLKCSMETVGFSKDTQQRIWCVLAAVLHLGNITFTKKRHGGHHDAVEIENPETVALISSLLKVKEATLTDALTKKKTQAGSDTIFLTLNLDNATGTRDAMAKCLYSALFDWIVLQVNQALVSKRDFSEHKGNSIGVLDIFGFEDFGNNSFEQFCINYANEHLQQYFNQHVFKYEQEEYVKEGIVWQNIEFMDNKGCLDLFSKRPTGLLLLLDEECNFPGASNQSLLSKFNTNHKSSEYYESPQMREDAFFIVHYAGKVKYSILDFREKNLDMMRHDVMLVLKNSSQAFVRELVGYDPVAMLRWSIVRVFFRSYFAFIDAGRRYRARDTSMKYGGTSMRKLSADQGRSLHSSFNASTRALSPPTHKSIGGVFQVSRALIRLRRAHTTTEARTGRRLLIIEKSASVDSMPTVQVNNGWENSHLDAHDYKVMRRASRVLQKAKQYKPKTRTVKQLRDLQRMKTLSSKTPTGPRTGKGKNKPPSVSAQFNFSLQKLLETLNKSTPFFIRCIKSNMEKKACKFDDSIVLRQLRYTGMLATVRIRQSGYNYRVTYETFRSHYRILLPRGAGSTREDLEVFLKSMDLNQANYQIGKTKVFLREAEKMLLDQALHTAIMTRIVRLQHWLRAMLERQRFLKIRRASIVIQKLFRGYLSRRRLLRTRNAVLMIQAYARGYLVRKRIKEGLLTTRLKEASNMPYDDSVIYDNVIISRPVHEIESASSDDEQETTSEDEIEPNQERSEITLNLTEHDQVPEKTAKHLTSEEKAEFDLSKRVSKQYLYDLDDQEDIENLPVSRSLSDSGAKSLDDEKLNLNMGLQTSSIRILRRSTSHTVTHVTRISPVKDSEKPNSSNESFSTREPKMPDLATSHSDSEFADVMRRMSRDASIEGEFEVPDHSPKRTAQANKRSSRPLSTSKVTDLDAVIAAQAEEAREKRASLDRQKVLEREEDEWNKLEIEFKPHSPKITESEKPDFFLRSDSADIAEQLSPTGSTASEHSVFSTCSGHDRMLKYLVKADSMDGNIMDSESSKRRSMKDITEEGAHDATRQHVASNESNKRESIDAKRKSLSSTNDVDVGEYSQKGEKQLSAGGELQLPSQTSTQLPSQIMDINSRKPGLAVTSPTVVPTSTDPSQVLEKIDQKTTVDNDIEDVSCDTCKSLGVRASHRLTCSDCEKLRLATKVKERRTSQEESLEVRRETVAPVLEHKRQRSVKYIKKEVYGEEGQLEAVSGQTGRSRVSKAKLEETDLDVVEPGRDDHKDNLAVKSSERLNEISSDSVTVDVNMKSSNEPQNKQKDQSKGMENDTVSIKVTAASGKQTRYVQEELDNVYIVERAKTPKTGPGSTTENKSAQSNASPNVSSTVIPSVQDFVQSSHKSVSPTPTKRNEPTRGGSFLSYTVKKKYKNSDPLQSDKKMKAASTSNLLANVTIKPKTQSTSQLDSPADVMPQQLERGTPARTPLKPKNRAAGSGDVSLSASDDSSLNRASSNEELEPSRKGNYSVMYRPRPDERSEVESIGSQRSSRSSTGGGRRKSEELLSGLLPGEPMEVYDAEPGTTRRRKYSDDGNITSGTHLDVSYNPQGGDRDSSGLNKSISEELLYPAQRRLGGSYKSKKRQSAPIVPQGAPLATQESLEEPLKDDPNVIVRVLRMDSETNRISFNMPGNETQPEETNLDAGRVTSPFSSKFKNWKSKLTGHKARKKSGEDLDDTDDSDDEHPLKAAYPDPQRVKEAWGDRDRQSGDLNVAQHKSSDKSKDSTTSTRSKKSPQRSRQQPKSKKQRAQRANKAESGNTWNVSRTSEWQYPTKLVVKDHTELRQLTSFMFKKKTEWEKNMTRGDSVMEKVFNSAFNEFINNLMMNESLAQDAKTEYRYHTLMLMFEKSFRSRASEEKDSNPSEYLTIGINSFRSYLDEFYKKKMNKELPDVPKVKKEKKRKKEKDIVIEMEGHMYTQVQLNIHTVCEMCNSRIIMSGYVCKVCHYAVHKKCAKSSSVKCKDYQQRVRIQNPGKVFGVAINLLFGKEERLPRFLEEIFQEIELQGFYTVGIYRKAGSAAVVRQLEKDLNTDPSSVRFNDHQVHALCSLLKKFLRDMPEPLMTFDLYDDFIRGTEIEDMRERTRCLFGVVGKLPQAHFILLQRLINHLARIAQHESVNKMSPSALAIIFAPTILRTDDSLPAQESLLHVPKQSKCVQAIIEEQLRKIDKTLEDMHTLETATNTAEQRLSSIRASTRHSKVDEAGASGPSVEPVVSEEEEHIQYQIRTMQKEKEMLADDMTRLEPCNSDDDLLTEGSTGDEIDDDDESGLRVKSLSASPSAKRKKRRSIYSGQDKTPTSKKAPKSPWGPEAASGSEALTGHGLMTQGGQEVFL